MTTAAPERVIHCYSRGSGVKQYDVTCPVPDKVHILEDSEAEQFKDRKVFGMFRVLTKKDGDKRLVWNRLNMAEIDAARTMFGDLIKQGMAAYRVDGKGRQSSEIMADFDPLAEEVIFVPVRNLIPG